MIRALFICSANRLRSPTAEQVFSDWQGVETDSAGLNAQADTRVSSEQLDWATHIFVMERRHKSALQKSYQSHIKGKKVICLGIPDHFHFMEDTLVSLLVAKVSPYLKG